MKRKSRNSSKTQNFDVVVNGGQVEVRATPYLVNQEEMRFRVSYNDSPVYIFAWDKEHRGLTVVDDRSIPKPVEQAIAGNWKPGWLRNDLYNYGSFIEPGPSGFFFGPA